MSTTHEPDARRRTVERPETPAQIYAGTAGFFLVALGVLSLIFADMGFGTIDAVVDQPEFLIWTVSGWTTIFWLAMGGLGLLSMTRLDTARTYSLVAGVVFAGVAVWGFVDGNEVAEILAADTTNNLMHAILAGLGLVAGMLPTEAQRPVEPVARAERTSRFDSGETVRRLDRPTMGPR